MTTDKCKICRRLGDKLFLKGEKCFTNKCPYSRRSYPPGQHGKAPARVSEYGIRLREKQKARRIYGLTERQFESYFDVADSRKGATGEVLLELLERRLDNVVFRLGFAASRQMARQMVRHGGVEVKGRKVDIPAYQVKDGEVIKIRPKYVAVTKVVSEKFPDHAPPAWLTRSGEIEGKVVGIPSRDQIDTVLEDHLIVEYYSR